MIDLTAAFGAPPLPETKSSVICGDILRYSRRWALHWIHLSSSTSTFTQYFQVSGVDLYIGAHSHSLLLPPDSPDYENAVGPYPTIVKDKAGKTTYVVQADCFSLYAGFLEVKSWSPLVPKSGYFSGFRLQESGSRCGLLQPCCSAHFNQGWWRVCSCGLGAFVRARQLMLALEIITRDGIWLAMCCQAGCLNSRFCCCRDGTDGTENWTRL